MNYNNVPSIGLYTKAGNYVYSFNRMAPDLYDISRLWSDWKQINGRMVISIPLTFLLNFLLFLFPFQEFIISKNLYNFKFFIAFCILKSL